MFLPSNPPAVSPANWPTLPRSRVKNPPRDTISFNEMYSLQIAAVSVRVFAGAMFRSMLPMREMGMMGKRTESGTPDPDVSRDPCLTVVSNPDGFLSCARAPAKSVKSVTRETVGRRKVRLESNVSEKCVNFGRNIEKQAERSNLHSRFKMRRRERDLETVGKFARCIPCMTFLQEQPVDR